MTRKYSLRLLGATILFSTLMAVWACMRPGIEMGFFVVLVIYVILTATSLIVYFLLCLIDEEFRLMATIMSCIINIYCGLVFSLGLPFPFLD